MRIKKLKYYMLVPGIVAIFASSVIFTGKDGSEASDEPDNTAYYVTDNAGFAVKHDSGFVSYETVERTVCSDCGMDITGSEEKHFADNQGVCKDSYKEAYYVQVDASVYGGGEINED